MSTLPDPHSLTTEDIVALQQEVERLRFEKETITMLLSGPVIGGLIKNVFAAKNPRDGIMKTVKVLMSLMRNPGKLKKELDPIKDRLNQLIDQNNTAQ